MAGDETIDTMVDDLKAGVRSLFVSYGMTLGDGDLDAVINRTSVRNLRIRQEYRRRLDEGEKCWVICYELSTRYFLTPSTIKSIVSRKTESGDERVTLHSLV